MKIRIIEIDTDDNQYVKINYPNQIHTNDSDNYDPCINCSNNPKNGGSGICHCTLPYMYGPNRVTC